ncbi:hypothetical protein Y032_0250g133 [Ancylostoma ceylanicum]|uniref:Uncharacterized protein n=1 Tax=Ancylostoma ceylanicum TaxID=53326 RepID=A0A016SD46_9BILA|nr:hypothetical protein Y032_0250g133 [Ancylostoma ceylanicum]
MVVSSNVTFNMKMEPGAAPSLAASIAEERDYESHLLWLMLLVKCSTPSVPEKPHELVAQPNTIREISNARGNEKATQPVHLCSMSILMSTVTEASLNGSTKVVWICWNLMRCHAMVTDV